MRPLNAQKGVLLATATAAVALLSSTPALGAVPPIWSIQSLAAPTTMQTTEGVSAQVVQEPGQTGPFTLTYQGQITEPIAQEVSDTSVEAALDALSSIGGAGGSVDVTGAGKVKNAYYLTFQGGLRGAPAAAISASNATLTGATHDEYAVQIENIGQTATSGTITVTDKLPPGATTSAGSTTVLNPAEGPGFVCSSQAGLTEVTCTSEPGTSIAAGADQYNVDTVSGVGVFEVLIPVTIAAGVSGSITNTATVAGGAASGVASVSSSNPVNTSASPAFGVSSFNVLVNSAGGAPFTQAGGHPYAVTTDFDFNLEPFAPETAAVNYAPGERGVAENAVGGDDLREIAVDLPLGLIGNPLAAPRCPLSLLGKGPNLTSCPRDTQVGLVYLDYFGSAPNLTGPFGLFNMVPELGRPGEFAFDPIGDTAVVLYGTVVRTPLGNVVRVDSSDPRARLHGASFTFFGNPIEMFAQKGEDEEQLPFLINPTNCQASEAQRTMTMHVDSWDHPGALNPDGTPDFSDSNWKEASTVIPPVEGCNLLKFDPSHFELAPSGLLEGAHQPAAGGTTQADEPSAYEGRLKIPQVETFGTLSRPELKSATVTLPAGLSVSASAANGLEGCSEAQLDPASGEPGHCPEGSKLGTVEVTTPLLSKPLQGHVYLAEPKCGEESEPACVESEAEEGKLFGLDIELDGEAVVKIPGYVEAGGYGAYSAAHGLAPGQLRSVFPNDPQVPFGELVFKFKEGPRTPLANPQTCGTFTTSSLLEPWSAPFSANATSESSFGVDWDGHGGACPASMPFSPGFTAGTASSAAGSYSPLVLEFSRHDREQDLSTITVHTPAGLLGNLSNVPLCGEPQAAQGACGEASQIGTTTAVVGPGEDPFTITGGRVYLTGPYKGQPFGLSIVVPANAGPFHLGNVVVRASIAVDPHTAALTVSSDALPQVVDSVPIRLRKVIVDVNRPGFIFNATDCVSQKLEATVAGLEGFTATHGASVSVSSPYTAGGCAGLKFAPKFAVSTSGHTTKALGASLTAKLSYPAAPQGTQSNITRVKVDLPVQLPSQLKTLQKACLAKVFESNPAACPPESIVGHATVRTPILPVPLVGPAYFVSHGGAAFPDLTIVLQGYGVTVDLVGSTFISKAGITSTTFETVPDTPFNTFELTLPQGKFSALASNLPASAKGSFCGQKLAMPTEFLAQNGAEIHESTPVEVEGCPDALSVMSSKVKKRTLTLSVYAPAAGKVTVSGKGLSSGSKSYSGREALSFTLKQKKAGKLKTKIKLTFTPSNGKKQTKTVKADFKH